MATIRKRKNKEGVWGYHVQVRIKGSKPVTKSWPTRREAERWAAQTETEIREGRYFNKAAAQHTVAEAIDKFVAHVSGPDQSAHHKRQCRELHYWRKAIGDHFLENIDPAIIEAEQKKLLATISPYTKRLLSPTTVRHSVIALSSVFSYICRVHTKPRWLAYNPIRDVEKPKPNKGRVRYLKSTEEGENELHRLLAACKEVVEFRRRNQTLYKAPGSLYLYYIVHLALLTGLRSGEIKKLKWEDVNFIERNLRLYDTKNKKNYTFPIVTQALELLQICFQTRRTDTPYVFPSKNGKKPTDWTRPFREAMNFADIKGATFHTLRHTFLSYGAMNGASKTLLKEMGRHESEQASEVYLHLSEHYVITEVQDMVDKRFGSLTAPKESPIPFSDVTTHVDILPSLSEAQIVGLFQSLPEEKRDALMRAVYPTQEEKVA